MITDSALATLLIDTGEATKEDIEKAKKYAIEKHTTLYDAVLEQDILSEQNLGKLLAEYYKVPLITLANVMIDESVLRLVPEFVARKQKILLFGRGDQGLKLAMNDPEQSEVAAFIAKKTGEHVTRYFALWHDINRAYGEYKSDTEDKLKQILKSYELHPEQGPAPIEEVVNLIIEFGFINHASDIHIEPQKEADSVVRFRIDGILHDALTIPKEIHQQVITRIKVACGLKTDEHAAAQDGKMHSRYAEQDIDIRVSIIPTTVGEKAVLRLLSSQSRQFSLTDLGMSEADLSKVREAFAKPYGMLLSTGPTGCGKTTTIYSILKIMNTRDVNIATIEDPVEYEIPGISQIQVNPATNLTFADGLKSILRQDPNVIFVGEIRDEATAGIAVNAATTGHLVLSTVHTNNASTTLPRLLDMRVEPFLIATTVNVIIGQRLVRKVCEACRTSVELDPMTIEPHIPEAMYEEFFDKESVIRVYHGKGCDICHHTGYVGRTGIFEVLVISESIRKLIMEKGTASEIEAKAVAEGMTTMLVDGLRKMQEGITTLDEVLRATKE